MKISEEVLNNISSLSKIKIDEDIKPKLIEDLESILLMVEKMNKIDTSKIEPMSHPLDEANNLREDKARHEIKRDDYQKSAPQTEDGFYLTPKVIE
jgi:aspartyl-tRNA(Asn)/glutamyl-tRNA(Gln) amidotransferase subunit C